MNRLTNAAKYAAIIMSLIVTVTMVSGCKKNNTDVSSELNKSDIEETSQDMTGSGIEDSDVGSQSAEETAETESTEQTESDFEENTEQIETDAWHWVEYGCAYGTVFIKPNGESLDVFTPADVMIVDYDNQEIKGIIFKDSYTVGRKYYTRLEYHRFVETTIDGVTTYPYYVSNRAYVSKSPQSIGDRIDLKQTKWADLMADTPPILKANGEKLDGPLYGVLRTPQANNVDISTPLGLPIFAEAIEELKDLDIAYSRNAGEIFDSQKIVLADDRLLMPSGTPVSAMSPQGMENRRNEMNLPHFVKNVFGEGQDTFYQEINPQPNTQIPRSGNSLTLFIENIQTLFFFCYPFIIIAIGRGIIN